MAANSARAALQRESQLAMQSNAKRWGHSVRLIALEDLPHGKGYKDDVVTVKAGYARNFLVPQRKAVYATPQNFEKLGVVDPDFETEEQRIARLERESSMNSKEEKYLKQADILKKYLRNKVVSSSSSSRRSCCIFWAPHLFRYYFVMDRSSSYGE